MSPRRRTTYPDLYIFYSNCRKSAIWVTASAVFYRRVQNTAFHFTSGEIVFVDCFIIGVEVYLGLIELLTGKDFFHNGHEIAEHTGSESFLADVYHVYINAFRRHTRIYPY
jgi:hypothetical protein